MPVDPNNNEFTDKFIFGAPPKDINWLEWALHKEQDFEAWKDESMLKKDKIQHFKEKLKTYKKWGWEIPVKNCEKVIKKLGGN
jgi:hypothetical protein